MFRELEALYWVACNSTSEILKLVARNQSQFDKERKENDTLHSLLSEDEAAAKLKEINILSIQERLMMTAYSAKIKLSTPRTEKAVTEFLNYNFEDFISRHTFWELLFESPEVTPKSLNSLRLKLLKAYADFNVIVFP
jgi:hypothetical protein